MQAIKLLLIIISIATSAGATTYEPEAEVKTSKELGTKLVVGTKHSPPLSFKDQKGEWTGLCIELWKQIALQLGYTTEFKEFETMSALLDAVKQKKIDVAASAITMNAERDAFMDFTHTFAPAHLGIAVLPTSGTGWWDAITRIFSWDFAQAMVSLVVLLLITAFLLWIVERRHNADQFGGPSHRGIGAAFWWSAVTMTTVGYGDKAPITAFGRTLALLWMFASVMVISGFTGAIASSLTVGQLQPTITSPSQLPYVKVGTLEQSTASHWLDEHLIPYSSYSTTEEGLQALIDGNIQAFVNDDLVIRYHVRASFSKKILVLTETFDPGFYALAIPLGSPRMKPINIALLKEVADPQWEKLWRQYVGP
ncbi:MAG: transporter substrate-binding domain-containing protein [Phycisphaerales bacterium]|nr:transporter substrate-binding domain-containing protein [Phycisphaerales bacterium]